MSIKDMFTQKEQKEAADIDVKAEEKSEAEKIIAELFALEDEGKLSRPIEEYLDDSRFTELLPEFGTKAAVRIYDAERKAENAERESKQEAQDLIAKRRAMPKSIRSGMPFEPETDFSKLSTNDFERLKKRIRAGK